MNTNKRAWRSANFRASCEPFQDRNLIDLIKRDSNNAVCCDLGFNFFGSAECSGGTVREGNATMWVLVALIKAPTTAIDNVRSIEGVETVEVDKGCDAGKEYKYQCKVCTCDDDGKTASCPKWIKCCKRDEIWSTNSCNMCYCDDGYNRICKAISCQRRRFRWLMALCDFKAAEKLPMQTIKQVFFQLNYSIKHDFLALFHLLLACCLCV